MQKKRKSRKKLKRIERLIQKKNDLEIHFKKLEDVDLEKPKQKTTSLVTENAPKYTKN